MSKLSIGDSGKLLSQVHIGGNTRSLQVGIVSHEKGGNSSNDAEDKFKDDKFKDDPDVRGILTDIKSHFDQSDKGVNVPAEPNNEEAVVNEDESESKAKENEEGSGGGGTKNMKQLLEKIYGARTKAAASETSVGNDHVFILHHRCHSQVVIRSTAMQTPESFLTLMRREKPLGEQSRFCFDQQPRLEHGRLGTSVRQCALPSDQSFIELCPLCLIMFIVALLPLLVHQSG